MKTIEDLELKIKELKRQQALCKHNFGEPYNDSETKREEYYTGGYTTQGTHINYNTAYREVKIPRFTRKCNLCGKIQHTYEMVNVAKPVYEPKFG